MIIKIVNNQWQLIQQKSFKLKKSFEGNFADNWFF